jgi:hypothetical protein
MVRAGRTNIIILNTVKPREHNLRTSSYYYSSFHFIISEIRYTFNFASKQYIILTLFS